MSDTSTSQDDSKSVRRAIRLLVKSSPTMSCSLANSAMRVRARVWSTSHTLPISCMVWRWRVWICARISRVVSKTYSLLGAIFVGNALPLLPALGPGDPPEVCASTRDAIAPFDLTSRDWAACLAAHHCQESCSIQGKTTSETMFQWSSEGGWRLIAIIGPCIRPRGNFSNSYSIRDELLSPKK